MFKGALIFAIGFAMGEAHALRRSEVHLEALRDLADAVREGFAEKKDETQHTPDGEPETPADADVVS